MVKVYKSLDFSSAPVRIEPNDPGEYQVHLEDYESLNDLIRRSIRTRSKFAPETSENAVYDDFLDEVQEDFTNSQNIELTQPQDNKSGSSASNAERSEGQEAKNPDDLAKAALP